MKTHRSAVQRSRHLGCSRDTGSTPVVEAWAAAVMGRPCGGRRRVAARPKVEQLDRHAHGAALGKLQRGSARRWCSMAAGKERLMPTVLH